jgi:hypothetical protein
MFNLEIIVFRVSTPILNFIYKNKNGSAKVYGEAKCSILESHENELEIHNLSALLSRVGHTYFKILGFISWISKS